MAGPYRAEYGAIHHEDAPGFLFTVTPESAAEGVAAAMNEADEAARWRANVTSLLEEPDPDVIRAHEGGGPEDLVLSLVLSTARTRKKRDDAVNAIGALLVGLGVDAGPEAFPGHNEAFLKTVAMPRAEELWKSASAWREGRKKPTLSGTRAEKVVLDELEKR